jgi:DNA-binding GntR family transcriptional regulator
MAGPAPRSPRPRPAGAPPKRSADTVARLYDRLHRMLTRFEIKPGERLKEVELARALEVSRTPLREALNRLATDGLIAFEPNRGFRVRPLDTKDILDLYEARRVVELGAVPLACRRATPEEIEALAAVWREAVADAGRATTELLRIDELFHEKLVALSGNGELARMLRAINARIHFVRWMDLEREERRSTTYREHTELLEALAARDEVRCLTILDAHIGRRVEEIVEVIRAGVVHLYMR